MSKQKNNSTNAILLMHCPDQPGILAVVTDFINVNGGNILYLDQYVDRKNHAFFMRVEWDPARNSRIRSFTFSRP